VDKKSIEQDVDRIVARIGSEAAHVIPILHAVQRRFNYLPEAALRRVCEVSRIRPADITGISTFYSQFRHTPVGKHIISICTGTACHMKGAESVWDAFFRALKIEEGGDTDPEGLFTLQRVACLGCCTIAPVVQIDGVTYGHVQTDGVSGILDDFLRDGESGSPVPVRGERLSPEEAGEIKIGLGSCCIAGGSQKVKQALEKTVARAGIQPHVKRVGCVGMCHRTPLLEINKPGEEPVLYDKVRPEDVRRCVACVEGCGTPCSINYDLTPGVEPSTPAETSRKVLVVGGGVAGMEAARVAAERGHRVTLVEKRSELGGMVAALAREPLTAEFANLVEYLRVQLQKLGVDVRLSTEAGPAEVDELGPEAVIVATGSSMIIPEVATGKPGVMDHIEALRNRKQIGQRVVVWGFTYGAELAISLAEEGREVVLIGEGAEKTLGGHASNFRRWWILRKLSDVNTARGTPEAQRIANPKVLSSVRVEEITSEGIALTDEAGSRQVLPYDTLIISRGRERDNALSGQLEGSGPEVHEIGDCSSVGDIQKAIFSANEVARAI
jgi:NADH:ubiquinone oxidoreductase subunit E/thioredoxin reductase